MEIKNRGRDFFSLSAGFMLFKFGSIEDKVNVLERRPWFFCSKFLIMKEWDPNERLERINFSTLPIWIHIYNLPLKRWLRGIIGQIMSAVGRPLLYG